MNRYITFIISYIIPIFTKNVNLIVDGEFKVDLDGHSYTFVTKT
jgi:hypothetical protein